MDDAQFQELMYQALETEIGGQLVYEAAIECAVNDDLREEWGKYLDETRTHETILRETFGRIGLDPEQETPGSGGRPVQGRVAGAVDGDGARGRRSRRGPARRRRVRRRGGDEGPPELGADRQGRRSHGRRDGGRARRGVRQGRGGRGRAPLSHDGLGARALDRVARACPPCCRRPKRRRRSRPRSAPRGPRTPARRCSSHGATTSAPERRRRSATARRAASAQRAEGGHRPSTRRRPIRAART